MILELKVSESWGSGVSGSLEDLGKSEALKDFQGAGSGMKRAGVES